jgi:hypothetical protein
MFMMGIKFITVLLIAGGALTVVALSGLCRHPMANAFLIVFISVPFGLFLVAAALAKRQLAHFMIIGFLIAAMCIGVFQYHGHQYGPEIPTVYFAVPIIQGVLALLSLLIAAIDFFVARRRARPVA